MRGKLEEDEEERQMKEQARLEGIHTEIERQRKKDRWRERLRKIET